MENKENFIRPEEMWKELGLRAEQTVVHLGCGAGFYLVPAAKIVGKNGKAIGVDVLPDMLAETENKARRENVEDIVQTVRANLENTPGSPLDENSADWVLVANILHQSDPEKILQEAARVVAVSGSVVVAEWDIHAAPFGPPPQERRSKQEVIQLLNAVGLQVTGEFEPSPYHYGLIASKQT